MIFDSATLSIRHLWCNLGKVVSTYKLIPYLRYIFCGYLFFEEFLLLVLMLYAVFSQYDRKKVIFINTTKKKFNKMSKLAKLSKEVVNHLSSAKAAFGVILLCFFFNFKNPMFLFALKDFETNFNLTCIYLKCVCFIIIQRNQYNY